MVSSTMESRIADVCSRIESAAAAAGRSAGDIVLIGVSKFQPVEAIAEAYGLGLSVFGENRVQERSDKAQHTADMRAEWHMIGHLQRNKARRAVELFDTVQSAASAELISLLDRYAGELGRVPYPVMVEINTSGEESKQGAAPEECERLVEHIVSSCPSLRYTGLMTIGPLEGGMDAARRSFAMLREMASRVDRAFGVKSKLSMGMTGDFEAAIAEGSDMVRVGTGIFGPRQVH